MSPDETRQHLRIEITPDGLTATLVVAPDAPTDGIDEATLQGAIFERALTITPELSKTIKQAVLELAQPREPGTEYRLTLAHGQAPVDGTAGKIQFEPGFDPDQIQRDLNDAAQNAELAKDKGSIDHYTKTFYHLVKPGDHVASLIFPSFGVDGLDVFGKVIPAKQPPTLDFTVDDTLIKQNDGRVIALVSGVLEWAERGLHVTDNLNVPGYVDFSTGHVDFPGSVIVQKGVRDCFRISAATDITVNGLVEAATIKAQRDATLAGGMAARGMGTLDVRRDANAKYLDNVATCIGRDLTVEKEIVNSRVDVGRCFNGKTCVIKGGRFSVSQTAIVDTLGSETGVLTEIFLGSIPELEAVLKEAMVIMPILETRKAKIGEPLMQLRSVGGRLPASQIEQLTQLEFEMKSVETKIDALQKRIDEIRSTIAARSTTDLLVYHKIYPKVFITAGNYTIDFFGLLHGPVRLSLAGGVPLIATPEGSPLGDLGRVARVRKIDIHVPTQKAA